MQAEGYYRTCPVATSENLHSQYKFDSTNLKKGWFFSHFLHSWSFCGIKEKNCQVFMKVFIFILLNCYCMKKCPNTEFFQLFLKYTHENVKICIYSNIFDKIAWTNSPSWVKELFLGNVLQLFFFFFFFFNFSKTNLKILFFCGRLGIHLQFQELQEFS